MRKDKARDIARGVLPSTARKGARDNKREFHAKHRHAQRQANNAIVRHCSTVSDHGTVVHDPDLFDDFEDLYEFDGYTAATTAVSGWGQDMKDIVYSRRGADKLGPLISWARATEKDKMNGWSVEDKVAYFKAVLPDSLQGRHALGHVESALDLHTDAFRYSYRRNRPDPVTKEKFRAALARHLSTSKSRIALREFLLETVPVAAHSSQTNNKVRTSEPAVNEDGSARYAERPSYANGPLGTQRYRVMVDVYVPQIVAVTCDDCSFLRNDPLATTEAINRFVDICWAGRPGHHRLFYFRRTETDPDHPFMHKIFEYVHAAD